MSSSVAVVKIGGSVLSGRGAFSRTARLIADRLERRPGERIVAVASAEYGLTDELLTQAHGAVDEPDSAVLDLLWSTGELRSVALLTFSLHALGVRSAAASIHQAGLTAVRDADTIRVSLQPLRLRALLADHDVVVVPGFFARTGGDRIVSLGRGGSDLAAVLVAAGLGLERCELLKDVDGYFTADPRHHAGVRPLASLTYAQALDMAAAGCELVQAAALEAARTHRLELIVRAADGIGTRIN